MSRLCEMGIYVFEVKQEEVEKIRKALSTLWDWEHELYDENRKAYHDYGQSSLCGGESDEEFSRRCAEAVWEALGRYAEVEVDCTYLESLPYEEYTFYEDEYTRWKDKKEGGDEEAHSS